MSDKHISDILDKKSFAELNADEKRLIEEHGAQCGKCFSAYRAAEASSYLIKFHAEQSFEPPPFFAERVTAKIRDKKALVNPFALVLKMWRASRPLVAMMTLIIAILAGLVIFAPKDAANPVAETNNFDLYSTEMVILDERLPSKEPTNEQIFRAIYSPKSNSGK